MRAILYKHAEKISDLKDKIMEMCITKKSTDVVISQSDGSMVPIVESDTIAVDKRKGKSTFWREAKSTLAYASGSHDTVYESCIDSPDAAGALIKKCVQLIGMKPQTKVHCLGDGAPWIYEQIEEQFGSRASYLIDFYHLSGYLGETAECNDQNVYPPEQLRKMCKDGQVSQILRNFELHCQGQCASLTCKTAKCYNYMIKRLNQFDYHGAIASDLPIGSGRIESSHRYVIQKRLKLPGAWWKLFNAQIMLNVRSLRSNGLWNEYWNISIGIDQHF